MKNIKFEINGEWKQLEIQESWSLLYIIREVLGLTGTKCGCQDSCLDGGCGACVVIVDGEAKRSCRIQGFDDRRCGGRREAAPDTAGIY